jgi:hypothetical protein
MLRFIWGGVIVGLIVLEMCLNAITAVDRTAPPAAVKHAAAGQPVR